MLMVCSSVAPRLFILTLSPVKSPWGRFDPPGRSVSLIMAKLLVQCLQLCKYPGKTAVWHLLLQQTSLHHWNSKKESKSLFLTSDFSCCYERKKILYLKPNYFKKQCFLKKLALRSQLFIWNWLCISLNSSLYEKNCWK